MMPGPITEISGGKTTRTQAYPGLVNLNLTFFRVVNLYCCHIRVLTRHNPVWSMPEPGEFAKLSLFLLREMIEYLVHNTIVPLESFFVKVLFVQSQKKLKTTKSPLPHDSHRCWSTPARVRREFSRRPQVYSKQ